MRGSTAGGKRGGISVQCRFYATGTSTPYSLLMAATPPPEAAAFTAVRGEVPITHRQAAAAQLLAELLAAVPQSSSQRGAGAGGRVPRSMPQQRSTCRPTQPGGAAGSRGSQPLGSRAGEPARVWGRQWEQGRQQGSRAHPARQLRLHRGRRSLQPCRERRHRHRHPQLPWQCHSWTCPALAKSAARSPANPRRAQVHAPVSRHALKPAASADAAASNGQV